MKRFGMILLVALTMGANLFAAGNLPTTEKENWNVNINVSKLSRYLQLSGSQQEEVAYICAYFNEQMVRASHSRKNKKEAMLHNAIYGNLKLMKGTLNEKQYGEYVRLLNITLRNRGIAMEQDK